MGASKKEAQGRRASGRLLCLPVIIWLLATGSLAGEGENPGHGTEYIPHPPDLETYRSSVVILHFWATWCGPCMEEIPALAEFYRDCFDPLKKEGMVLLTVSNDLRAKDLHRFLENRDLPFPIYFDPYQKFKDQLDVFALPTTLIINRKGRIVESLAGPQLWNCPEMTTTLRAHLESGQPLRTSSK